MCNRCDGGEKPIVKMKCSNEECSFVYYVVEDGHKHEEDITDCPKCEGIGVLFDGMA